MERSSWQGLAFFMIGFTYRVIVFLFFGWHSLSKVNLENFTIMSFSEFVFIAAALAIFFSSYFFLLEILFGDLDSARFVGGVIDDYKNFGFWSGEAERYKNSFWLAVLITSLFLFLFLTLVLIAATACFSPFWVLVKLKKHSKFLLVATGFLAGSAAGWQFLHLGLTGAIVIGISACFMWIGLPFLIKEVDIGLPLRTITKVY